MTATAANTARSFGAEFEVMLPAGKTHEDLAAAIRAGGVPCRSLNYTHAVHTYWKVVTDGSLGSNTSGAEVVSPILRGERGIEAVRSVCKAMTDFGCKVNVKCGFHVHVDASGLDAKAMKSLAKSYVWFESFFDFIMPVSRRADSNQYVKSNRSIFGGYSTDAVKNAFAALDLCDTVEKVIETTCPGGATYGRYRKLNLQAFNRHRTVEFRQHSGTTDADKAEHWIRLCLAIVEKAPRCRIRNGNRPVRSATYEMNLFFAMFSDVPAETKAFFRDRCLHFARLERAGQSSQAAA